MSQSISDLECLYNISSWSFPAILPFLCSSYLPLNRLVLLQWPIAVSWWSHGFFVLQIWFLYFALVWQSFSWETVNCCGENNFKTQTTFKFYNILLLLYLYHICLLNHENNDLSIQIYFIQKPTVLIWEVYYARYMPLFGEPEES